MRTIRRLPFVFSLLIALVVSSCNPIVKKASERRQRNAKNLASYYNSAVAAGANLSSAKNKYDAIELMRRGVYGTDSFSTTNFQIPPLSDKEAERASRYLVFETNGQLIYSEEKVP